MWNKGAVTNAGWAHHFTDTRISNVNCSAAQEHEHEKKDELVELFPLHPDGNLRSKCISSFNGHIETNNIREEGGEWLSLKFLP